MPLPRQTPLCPQSKTQMFVFARPFALVFVSASQCNDLLTYCLHLELLTYLWLGSSPVTTIVTSLERRLKGLKSENSDASDVLMKYLR